MIMFEPSETLGAYIDKVQAETSRPVSIRVVPPGRFAPGITAQTGKDPDCILVEISPGLQGDQLEQSIAHEITHGLLTYGSKNYCSLNPKQRLNQVGAESLSALQTMIEDIVVNKLIQEEGFSPYAFDYLNEVKRETTSARKGRDYYSQFKDTQIKHRFMVFRYIMAWGYLEYFDLDPHARRTLVKFLKAFESSYPDQHKMAVQIRQAIAKNDIFTAEGYEAALRECLSLWKLDHLVQIVR